MVLFENSFEYVMLGIFCVYVGVLYVLFLLVYLLVLDDYVKFKGIVEMLKFGGLFVDNGVVFSKVFVLFKDYGVVEIVCGDVVEG